MATLAVLTLIGISGAVRANPGTSMDPNELFTDQNTVALAQAVTDGDSARIQRLLRQGADINVRGERDITLLQWAMLEKSPKGFEALLEANADPEVPAMGGAPIILMAAKTDDPIYMRMLLAHGADPSKPRAPAGETPLMAALMNGNSMKQFHMLLEDGADPSQKNKMGDSALHVAAGVGAFDEVLTLLEAGADPLGKNRQGATFQEYLALRTTGQLAAGVQKKLDAIHDWLHANNVPVEAQSTP